MLNKEKYAKEIVEAVVNSCGRGVGLKDGKPFPCYNSRCDGECDLSRCAKGCGVVFMEWANGEYVEPSVDWSKVPVDTPILVRNSERAKWKRRYFAGYDCGEILAWYDGATSWSNGGIVRCRWKFAKLSESEGEQ